MLSLSLAAVMVALSKARTPPDEAVRDVSSGVVFLMSWLTTSVKRGA